MSAVRIAARADGLERSNGAEYNRVRRLSTETKVSYKPPIAR